MIDYGKNIYQLKNNIYFAPYLQTIFETTGESLNHSDLKNWLQNNIAFKFAVQSI